MNPFSPRMLIALFGIGVVTFVLGLLLTAFGGDLFGELSAGHDGYSRSLVGHRALVEFLRESGLPVVVSRRSVGLDLSENFPLLLLEPVPSKANSIYGPENRKVPDDGRLSEILGQAVEAKVPVVLSLPKRGYWIKDSTSGWIAAEKLLPLDQVEGLLQSVVKTVRDEKGLAGFLDKMLGTSPLKLKRCPALSGVQAKDLGVSAPEVDLGADVQVIEASALVEPLLQSSEGVIIGRVAGTGDPPRLHIISDPDLFNNRGLGRGDHAVLIHGLIEDALKAEGVMIDEAVHGFTSQPSLTALAMSFPMVLIVIHAFLALGVAIWAASARFGKAVPPPPELPPGKELLIDNTSKLLLQGHDHAYALRRYMKVTMADVARRYMLREGTSQKDLLPRLQELTKVRGISVNLAGLDAAARKKDLTPAESLRIARKIYTWRESLLGTRKRER